ncbi:hypothetical protein PYH37_000626 [Sinorhizobium numidicum]|uniref:DUF2283 domain-containing protein n=1 Tax=Sinorhizobium numidicum TaxID=680248 RepID=A0ABY8CW87_9HYPH|nr:hypothetical protein [Sinorhizobium numidicum]WEX75241.1 hypothetical protein PYH37_000626 [Sinorhizobium numidicum]WEX81236.1 hypothetical protein PYH38_000628 [Sinorhizobium numidicum]
MEDNRATVTAEFMDNDIDVVSNDPLIGTLELISEQDEVIEVSLDRERAEALLSALLQFLAQGEGDDTPRITASTLQ